MAEEGKLKQKLISVLGFNNIDDEYDDDEYEEEEEEGTVLMGEDEALKSSSSETNRYASPIDHSPTPQNDVIPDVLVLDPVSFDEAPGIVNRLKQDRTIVVNLKSIDYDEGRHIFDFLSGAVYALEGSLNRIDESVFILAPSQITVGTNINNNSSTSYNSRANIPSWEDNK